MKRKFLSLASLFLMALTLCAAPISREQAHQQAAQFAIQHMGLTKNNVPGTAQARVRAAQSQLKLVVETPQLYGFDVSGSNGFIIVSGDDRTMPVLGYATNGSLGGRQQPPALKAWLANMRHEIALLAADATLARKSVETAVEVAPLLTTQWGQEDPFNLQCPSVGGAAHAVTGCVATAMAQVMYYYRHPAKTTKAIPQYTTQSYNIYRPSLPATSFDWDAMANSSDRTARAKLMAYCGQAVEMDYGPYGSSSSASSIPAALVNYFDYDASARHLSRSAFGIDEWEGMVRTELQAARPVIYSGQDAQYQGHSFIVDGCEPDGTFHVNWGWAGFCDGYYLLSVLDHRPSPTDVATEDGFSMEQDMIIGMRPNTGAPYVAENNLTIKDLYYTNTTSVLQRTDKVGVYWELINNSGSELESRVSIALYKEKALVAKLVNYSAMTIGPGRYLYSSYEVSIPSTLADGDYRIVMTNTLNDETMACIGSDTHYIGVHIDGSEMSLSLYPQNYLMVRSLSYPAGRVSGQVCELVANVQNRGSEYNGALWLFVNGQKVSGNGAYIRADGSANVKFHLKPASKIVIATDDECTNVIYEGPDTKAAPIGEGSDVVLNNLELASGGSMVKRGEALQATMAVVDLSDGANPPYTLAYAIDGGELMPIADVPSLASGASVCSISIDLPASLSSGEHQLSVRVMTVDGKDIAIAQNDGHEVGLTFTLYNEDLGRQKLFLGHYTGTWCKYCPLGDGVLDALAKQRSDYVMVSFHDGDELTCALANAYNQFAQGYPSVFYDFAYDAENESLLCEGIGYSSGEYGAQLLSSRLDALKSDMSFATVNLKAAALDDGSVRIVATGRRTSDFEQLVGGNINLTLMLTEDSIVCRQRDGDVYIDDYLHHGVLRTLLTPAWGTPITWKDDSFEMTFTFMPDKTWNVEHLSAVALLGKPYDGNNLDELRLQNCNDLSLRGLEKMGVEGDLNGDGKVDVTDIRAVIEAITGNDTKADANGDGVVNVADILFIINSMQNSSPK